MSEVKRFSFLGEKINSGKATLDERKEYMRLARKFGVISEDQFSKFNSSTDPGVLESILRGALIVGAFWAVIKLMDGWEE